MVRKSHQRSSVNEPVLLLQSFRLRHLGFAPSKSTANQFDTQRMDEFGIAEDLFH